MFFAKLYQIISNSTRVIHCTRFRGDMYIMKKVKVASLASDMSTGHPYQKVYQSYGTHKDAYTYIT